MVDRGKKKQLTQNVLILLPTYNETESIQQIIELIQQMTISTRDYNFTILVVDDDSPDGTAHLVKVLQKRYANILLSSGKKAGLGRAYLRGFRYTLARPRWDALIMMDADLSHDPQDIPPLLEALRDGTDYAIGSRYVVGGAVAASWPWRRRMTSRIANFVAHKLVDIPGTIADTTGGFKAIRLEALARINLDDLRANGYVFQLSLLHAFLRHGFRVTEVPVTFTNREYGNSKLQLRDIIEFLYRAYKLNPDAPVQRIVRFCFVGACGTLVNLALLSLFINLLNVDALVAAAIAIESSIIFNFFLNHYYTFRGYGSYPLRQQRDSTATVLRKLLRYNVGTLGGAVIAFVMFAVFFKLFDLHYLLADLLAIGVATSWNYWVSIRFVWRDIDREEIS